MANNEGRDLRRSEPPRRKSVIAVWAAAAVRPAALQVVVAISTAASISGATLLSSDAADHWQEGLRQQIAWSAALQEDVRYLYQDEAPPAWQVEVDRVIGARLAQLSTAPGPTGVLATVEAESRARTAAQSRVAHEGTDTLLGSDRYRLPGGGVDVPRRLADLRRQHATPQPQSTLREGDLTFQYASIFAACSVPLVALQLLVAAWRRRRSRGRRLAPGPPVNGTISEPFVPHGRSNAFLRGVATAAPTLAWVAIAVLPAVQLHFAKEEQRMRLAAARQSVEVTTAIACGSMLNGYSDLSLRTLLDTWAMSVAEQLSAPELADADIATAVTAVAEQRESALPELDTIHDVMSRTPEVADGVDPAAVASLTASPAELRGLSDLQRHTADDANLAGQRASLLNLSIFLAALAATIQRARGGRLGQAAGLVLLLGAATSGVLALVP